MQRFTMQNGVAATHVLLVLHNEAHILLMTDVHDAARRQLILDEDVKEDVDCRLPQCCGDFT